MGEVKSDTPSGTRRRKRFVWWAGAGLVLLALAFGLPWYLHSRAYESTDDAFIEGQIVSIGPRVAGTVARVHVRDNQWVAAGDLLVELDPGDFQARLHAATAILAAAEAADRARRVAVELTEITATAERDETGEGVNAARAAVAEAAARLTLARATLEQVRAEADFAAVRHRRDAVDLERYRQMSRTHTVSPQDLDHARAGAAMSAADLTAVERKIDTQQAAVHQAEAALEAAEARLGQAAARQAAARSAPQRIRQSRSLADASGADIDKAEADVALARQNLSYTRIFAPSAGFVTQKNVEPGQFVAAGQSLMAIVSRNLWVKANFKETQLTRLRPGQPVDISVDAYPDLTFHGHVDSIQRGTGARFSLLPAENATGNFVKVVQRVPVKIVFDRPETADRVVLAPGMSVVPKVNVAAGGRQDAPDGGVSKSTSSKTGTSP